MYLGDFVGTETINHLFTTVQATGAPTTLAGTPKLRVYKNGSTTESSDLTPTVDFDSRTGLNLVAIDLTGDSGFYATGNDFNIVITAGTVNSVSVVGYVVGAFSILKRSPLRPATAGRTLVVDASGLADANVVKLGPTGSGTAQTARDVGASVLLSAGSGAGQLDFTSGVVKANLAQILGTALTETAGLLAGGFKKFFNIATPASTMDVLARVTLTDTVTTYTGNTVQTGDNYARLGAPAGASVSADVAAVKSDTAAVKTATNTGVAPGAASGLAIVGSNMGTVASVTGAVGSVTGAVGSVTGNVGGNVTGSVGSVVGAVGSVTGNVGGNVVGSVATVTDITTTAQAELAAVPASNAAPLAKLNWLFLLARNKLTQTATTTLVKANDGTTTVGTSTVSDDATTATRGVFS